MMISPPATMSHRCDGLRTAVSCRSMPKNVCHTIQIGLFGVMLQSALLVGLLLKLCERFELPFGSVTIIVGLEALLVVTAASTIDFMVLVAVLGCLAGDVWLLLLRNRPGAFAFAVPATLYGCYILSLKLVYGTWWEVHALTGIVVVAGLTGWLVSFLMRRPPAASPAT
jgi:hypothetical protein